MRTAAERDLAFRVAGLPQPCRRHRMQLHACRPPSAQTTCRSDHGQTRALLPQKTCTPHTATAARRPHAASSTASVDKTLLFWRNQTLTSNPLRPPPLPKPPRRPPRTPLPHRPYAGCRCSRPTLWYAAMMVLPSAVALPPRPPSRSSTMPLPSSPPLPQIIVSVRSCCLTSAFRMLASLDQHSTSSHLENTHKMLEFS